MARGDITIFQEAMDYLNDGTFDPTDVIKVAILDNTTPPAEDDTTPALGDYTEVGTGGTYVAGGQSIGTLADCVSQAGGTMTFDSATNPTWAQDAGNDTDAYWALIHNSTKDKAIGFVDLGGPVDMSGGPLTVTWHEDGVYDIAPAA